MDEDFGAMLTHTFVKDYYKTSLCGINLDTGSSRLCNERERSPDEFEDVNAMRSNRASPTCTSIWKQICLDSLELQQNISVKNTFLDVSRQSRQSEDLDASMLRQRAASAPPTHKPYHHQETPSPADSLLEQYVVVAGPVRPATHHFLSTINEASTDVLRETLGQSFGPQCNLQVQVSYQDSDICQDVGSYEGFSQVVHFIKQLRDACPDFTFALDDVVVERDRKKSALAVCHVKCNGTQQYPLLPMVPIGRRASFALRGEIFAFASDGTWLEVRWSFITVKPALQMVKDITVQTPPPHAAAEPDAEEPDAEPEIRATEAAQPLSYPATISQPILFTTNAMAGASGRHAQFAESAFADQSVRCPALSLRQEADRVELAAAALRAQIRLEAMETQAAESTGSGATPVERLPGKTHAKQEPTTLMLRNIPNNYTRKMLLKMLNSNGFAGKYDFVYLPMDFETAGNVGYAFVNSITHSDAHNMQRTLDGFATWGIRSAKRCRAVWSGTQGLDNHIKYYRNSALMLESVPDEYKPILFRSGERMNFPAPTKKIKPCSYPPVKRRSE